MLFLRFIVAVVAIQLMLVERLLEEEIFAALLARIRHFAYKCRVRGGRGREIYSISMTNVLENFMDVK